MTDGAAREDGQEGEAVPSVGLAVCCDSCHFAFPFLFPI